MEILIVLIILGIPLLWLYIKWSEGEKKLKNTIEELNTKVQFLKAQDQHNTEEKYKNWGDDFEVTGPFRIRKVKAAKQCVFSEWAIDDTSPNGHKSFALVYGKANAEKVLKALNSP